MLVRCPRCETGFNLPVDKIPEKGAKLKCSACTHKFRVRLDEEGEPEIFYRKKSKDDFNNRTMIGGPISEVSDDGSPQTAPVRSKSASVDYDPFPLANKDDSEVDQDDDEHNERTQFGRPPTAVGSKPIEKADEDVDLFDEPFGGDGDHTQLGPAARSSATAGDSSPSRPPVPDDDERGQTQALGSASLDLFDGEFDDEPDPQPDLAEESDPFGDAFDEPVSGDVGLLMPSTPSSDDVPIESTSLSEGSHDSDPETGPQMGMSEDDFLSGHQVSEFGPVEDLVDPEFGEDVPAFDPSGGVVDREKKPKPGRGPKSRSGKHRAMEEEKLELQDVRDDRRETRSAERSRPTSRPAADQREAKPAPAQPKKRISNDYAPHRIGDPSPARRIFDVVAITLVVCVAFIGFVAARTGWVIDFTRFGHMLEVAFAGEPFQPREEWTKVVEVEAPEPPPEEPLRLEEVQAREVLVGDAPVFVISGRVRNYSRKAFQKVQISATIVDSTGEAIADQTVLAGQTLDREKLAGAKSVDDVPGLVDKAIPDVGKEGSVPFTVVFTELPADKLEAGELDYRVSLAE